MAGWTSRATLWARRAGVVVLAATTVTACAQFSPDPPGAFRDNPPLEAAPQPAPQVPIGPAEPFGAPSAPPSSGGPDAPPPPCADPDPAVVATCLDPTAAVAVLPGDQAALVAERRTGRLLKVAPQQPPVELAQVPVDASADGGLLGLALSPSYAQDQLIYLYLSTPTDNRVMRIAVGDVPKPVLVGIPHGAEHNSGAIAFDAKGNLLVATGDAGAPRAADNPDSLAGKLLRITATGAPAPGNPNATSAIAASGLVNPGGLCTDSATGTSYLTDRTPTTDRLRRVAANGSLGPDTWTWPDRPGAAGCAAQQGRISVALGRGAALYVITTAPSGAVSAPPEVLVKDRYGQLFGAGVATDGVVWAGTVNKTGGEPGPTDDRVVRIQPPSGQGGASAT